MKTKTKETNKKEIPTKLFIPVGRPFCLCTLFGYLCKSFGQYGQKSSFHIAQQIHSCAGFFSFFPLLPTLNRISFHFKEMKDIWFMVVVVFVIDVVFFFCSDKKTSIELSFSVLFFVHVYFPSQWRSKLLLGQTIYWKRLEMTTHSFTFTVVKLIFCSPRQKLYQLSCRYKISLYNHLLNCSTWCFLGKYICETKYECESWWSTACLLYRER